MGNTWIENCSSGDGEDLATRVLGTTLECEHCRSEIPVTAALSVEGADYVYHFCGPSCVEAWCRVAHAHVK